MELDFTGKTALVCGGSSGIGKAIALALAKCNANVILMAKDELKLEKVLAILPKKVFQNHFYVVADFGVPSFLRKVLERKFYGQKIDIVINNCGGPPPGLISYAETSDLERAFTHHVLASQIITSHFLPSMKENQFGRIINIISTSVKEPIYGLGVSNTIRGAMAAWSKTLSKEVASYGITVNNILPGSTQGARIEAIISYKAEQEGVDPEMIREKMIADIPAKRFALPEEIAQAAVFLVSNAAAYITGVNLPIDGGKMASI